MKRFAVHFSFALFLLGHWTPAPAQDSFYKGKTVRIIVGASAGGGYDTYSRTLSRHMGKHIPGNPTLAVENMPGAGFRISANHMYKIAKPDGLTIGHFIGGLFLQQLLGKPGIEFDARKFEYMACPGARQLHDRRTQIHGHHQHGTMDVVKNSCQTWRRRRGFGYG